MITEDYVSFETAKLLKEKGFDWDESPFYSEQDRDEWRQNNNYTVPNTSYNPDLPFDSETITLIVPHVSIQMVMKWLREKCIFITLNIICFNLNNLPIWHFVIWRNNNHEYRSSDYFDSYEEACEAAIKYCLENLI